MIETFTRKLINVHSEQFILHTDKGNQRPVYGILLQQYLVFLCNYSMKLTLF